MFPLPVDSFEMDFLSEIIAQAKRKVTQMS